jgi:hypothetical protein
MLVRGECRAAVVDEDDVLIKELRFVNDFSGAFLVVTFPLNFLAVYARAGAARFSNLHKA